MEYSNDIKGKGNYEHFTTVAKNDATNDKCNYQMNNHWYSFISLGFSKNINVEPRQSGKLFALHSNTLKDPPYEDAFHQMYKHITYG